MQLPFLSRFISKSRNLFEPDLSENSIIMTPSLRTSLYLEKMNPETFVSLTLSTSKISILENLPDFEMMDSIFAILNLRNHSHQ